MPMDAAALELGDLPDDRADGPAGGADHDRFAGFGLADVEQAHIRRKSGIPSTPSASEGRAMAGSSLVSSLPSEIAWLCQPVWPSTRSPGLKSGCCDASTRETVPPTITSPSATGAARRRVAHATAHVRIKREVVERAQQQLPGSRRGKRVFFKAEIRPASRRPGARRGRCGG